MDTASFNLSLLPNPFTPMAFLPPGLAYQTTVAVYILVGALSVLVWDILHNLTADYKLLFKYKIGIPTWAYFLSRIGALAYALTVFITSSAPVGNCEPWGIALSAFYPVVASSSYLLFFLRIKTIFDRNKYIVGFFFFMWIAVVGGSITVPLAATVTNIGPTTDCINSDLKEFAAAAVIIVLVNDTCVFSAITWRLTANAYSDMQRDRLKTVVFGKSLPVFSRAMLQDGQQYYLVTVIVNILTVSMVYAHDVPIIYRTMFSIPNIVLMNIMAARVYRNTRFGVFREKDLSTTSIMATRTERHGQTGVALPVFNQLTYPISIEVSKSVDHDDNVLSFGGHKVSSKVAV